MSRDIKDTKSLSDDDKLYLAQRGQLPTDVMSVEDQRAMLADSLEGLSLSDRANTGTVNVTGLTTEELQAELERRSAEAPKDPRKLFSDESGTTADEDENEEDDDEEVDYSSMKNDDLRAEIARRNEGRAEEDKLSLDGKKPDLIATLEADDAENSDEE